eukprot:scaffold199208_cov33-Tisochrysis_lutea.AAC.2
MQGASGEARRRLEAEMDAELAEMTAELRGEQRMPDGYCGSCYGAAEDGRCCNTCDEVCAAQGGRPALTRSQAVRWPRVPHNAGASGGRGPGPNQSAQLGNRRDHWMPLLPWRSGARCLQAEEMGKVRRAAGGAMCSRATAAHPRARRPRGMLRLRNNGG